MKAKLAAKAQAFTILNTDQKAQLQDMIKKMEAKMTAQYKDCHNS